MLGLAALILIALACTIAAGSAALVRRILAPPRQSFAHALALGKATEPEELDQPLNAERWSVNTNIGELPVWECTDNTDNHTDNHTNNADDTIVFIHGWARSRIDLINEIKPWRAHAQRFVLYDRRGHGDAPRNGHAIGPHHATDLCDVLQQLDDAPLILVAESLGCAHLFECLGQLTPERRGNIRGVILIAPVFNIDHAVRRHLQRRELPIFPIAQCAHIFLKLKRLLPPDNLAANNVDSPPTVIIHATDDPIVAQSEFEKLADNRPNTTRITIDAPVHLRFGSWNPDEWNKTVEQAIKTINGD